MILSPVSKEKILAKHPNPKPMPSQITYSHILQRTLKKLMEDPNSTPEMILKASDLMNKAIERNATIRANSKSTSLGPVKHWPKSKKQQIADIEALLATKSPSEPSQQ